MRIESRDVCRQNTPERTFGSVRTYYVSVRQELSNLDRVAGVDPAQVELVVTSLRGKLESLREEMMRITAPRSYPSVVILGPPHGDGKVTTYYPAENKVYLAAPLKGNERGTEVPYEEWTKNGGVVARVARSLIQPVPKSVRKLYQEEISGLSLS